MSKNSDPTWHTQALERKINTISDKLDYSKSETEWLGVKYDES